MLRCSKGRTWDTVVAEIGNAINNSHNRALKCSLIEAVGQQSELDPLHSNRQVNSEELVERIKRFSSKENKERNRNRKAFAFEPGMMVLVKKLNPSKMGARFTKPKTVVAVKRNDNVVLVRDQNKDEWINIKRLKRYESERTEWQNDALGIASQSVGDD